VKKAAVRTLCCSISAPSRHVRHRPLPGATTTERRSHHHALGRSRRARHRALLRTRRRRLRPKSLRPSRAQCPFGVRFPALGASAKGRRALGKKDRASRNWSIPNPIWSARWRCTVDGSSLSWRSWIYSLMSLPPPVAYVLEQKLCRTSGARANTTKSSTTRRSTCTCTDSATNWNAIPPTQNGSSRSAALGICCMTVGGRPRCPRIPPRASRTVR